jgi:hypothetical protein
MGRCYSQRAGKCDSSGRRTRLHHPSTHTRLGWSSSCLWCLTTFTRTVFCQCSPRCFPASLVPVCFVSVAPRLFALQAMSEPGKGTGGSSFSGFLLLSLLPLHIYVALGCDVQVSLLSVPPSVLPLAIEFVLPCANGALLSPPVY